MRLFKRLSQLISADAHMILDSMEEPEALLKQAIRDMTSIIQENEKQIEKIKLKISQLEQYYQFLNQEKSKLNQDLELCFENSNEQLARSVVKKKLSLDHHLEINQKSILFYKDKQQSLESQLTSNQQDYHKITQQAELLLSHKEVQKQPQQTLVEIPLYPVITEEDIEIAWLREKSKRGIQ